MMAITYQGLTGADFGPLQTAGEAWLTFSTDLEERLEQLDNYRTNDLKEENWDGDSAEAGRQRIKDFVADLDERSSQARRIAAAIEDAHDELKACQDELSELVGSVDRERASVTNAGGVIPDTSKGTDAIDYASGISTQIQEILDRASEPDAALNAAVGLYAETLDDIEERALDDLATGPAETLQELVDGGASPERINEWWNSLSGEEQIAMMDNHPEMLGGLDGIPTDTRDYSNRQVLEDEINSFDLSLDYDIARLEEQIAEMEANGEDVHYGGNLGVPHNTAEYQDLLDQLDELTDQRDTRDSLMDLQEAITRPTDSGQDHYLLGYDSSGDGQAIVSVGNPDTADNTAVYVPGTGSDLGNFPDAIGRAETMAGDAGEWGVPGEETAVIAWLDYDAPDEVVPNALDMSYANDAGPTLSQFTHGLESAHTEGGAHTTVVGHSYGTTVVGHTASEHGVEADKIIAVASPGMDTHSAEQLGVGSENVFVSTAEGDDIRISTDTWTDVFDGVSSFFGGESNDGTGRGADAEGDEYMAWHGMANPLHEDYGATQFASDPMNKYGEITDDGGDIHSGYWADGNVARQNMAYILSDRTEELILPDGHGS